MCMVSDPHGRNTLSIRISVWVLLHRVLPSHSLSVSPWENHREQMDLEQTKANPRGLCLCKCDLCVHSVKTKKAHVCFCLSLLNSWIRPGDFMVCGPFWAWLSCPLYVSPKGKSTDVVHAMKLCCFYFEKSDILLFS